MRFSIKKIVYISKKYLLSEALKNRVFKDSTKVENRKNLTNTFEYLSGVYNNIPFKIKNLTLASEYSKPKNLTTDYEAEGELNYLNTIINSEDYNFSNGRFKIAGNYNGTINSMSDVINSSEVSIESEKLIIESKHSKSRYNIPILELYINQTKLK